MKLFTMWIACLLIATTARSSTLCVGGGLTYFADSVEKSPYIEGMVGFGATRGIGATWTREADTQRVNFNGQYRLLTLPSKLGFLEADAGFGLVWEEWEFWRLEAAYGASILVPARSIGLKLGWLRSQEGGVHVANSRYYAGAYLAVP